MDKLFNFLFKLSVQCERKDQIQSSLKIKLHLSHHEQFSLLKAEMYYFCSVFITWPKVVLYDLETLSEQRELSASLHLKWREERILVGVCHIYTLESKQLSSERERIYILLLLVHTLGKWWRKQQLCKLISRAAEAWTKRPGRLRLLPQPESGKKGSLEVNMMKASGKGLRMDQNNKKSFCAFQCLSFRFLLWSVSIFSASSEYHFTPCLPRILFGHWSFRFFKFIHISLFLPFSVDIWSVGCIMGEMVKGSVIFQGTDRILHPSYRLRFPHCPPFVFHPP